MRLLVFVLVLLAACQQRTVSSSDVNNADTITDTTLSGKWILNSGLDTMPTREAFISFGPAKNIFTGNSGCNHMSGTYTRDGVKIQFNERIILTKMACAEYNEYRFIDKLVTTNNYRLNGNTLQLRIDSITALTFQRKN